MGKIQTNADYIRSMSDEELAAYILNFKNTYGEEYEGESSFLDWLREEKENTGRLTVRSENSGMVWFKDTENNDMCLAPCEMSAHNVRRALAKLADYEDAEEQGLLLRLPCKEAYAQSGDCVYLVYDDEVIECTHCGLSINPVDGKAYIALAADENIFPYRRPDPEHDLDPTDWCTNITDAEVNEIGKTVFFTRKEAEVKLKEMGGKSHDK